MPQPNTRELIVAAPLANISIAYRNASYIADRVFPIIDKIAPDAKIARYLKGAWFRDEADVRGPGARAKRGGYPIDYITVATKEYAFAKEVTDEDRRFSSVQGAPPLKPDQDAIEFATDKVDMKKERRVASMITAGTWSSVAGEDAAGLWVAERRHQHVLGRRECAHRNHPQQHGPQAQRAADGSRHLHGRQGTDGRDRPHPLRAAGDCLGPADSRHSRGGRGPGGRGRLFDRQGDQGRHRLYRRQHLGEKRDQGISVSFYRPSAPGLKIPSAGYQARVAYENGQPRRTTTWREAAEHQDVYEVAEETDIVQTGSDLGFLWYDTILT